MIDVSDIEIFETEDGSAFFSLGHFPPDEFAWAVAAYERDELHLDEEDMMGTDSWVIEAVQHQWYTRNQFTGYLRRCKENTEGAEAYTYLPR